MEELISKLNIYIIPPVLSLLIGLSLAILAIVKGKFSKENIQFSLVCIWWSCLLAPAFISHHLLKGDEETILAIERVIHFFFVWVPVVNGLYILGIMKVKRKLFLIITTIVSLTISLLTPTEYYFKGLYSYDWGYIAKGGIAFDVFGLYGFIVITFLAVAGIRKLRTEKNNVIRIKIKYIVFSLIFGGFLTLLNIPAINGIDFYPFGNLNFIPLGILAYGVLRFRLMDIRTIIHVTLMWFCLSSMVIIPNIFLIITFWPSLITLNMNFIVVLVLAWFAVNYFYMRTVQPRIDQLFNKRKFNLNQVESQFIENISQLKTLGDLIREFTSILKKTLSFSKFEIIRKEEDSDTYSTQDGKKFTLGKSIESWLLKNNDLMDRSLVETDPIYKTVRDKFIKFFDSLQCEFILPFIQNDEIIGFMTMPERSNLQQLTLDELRFINNIRTSAGIAISNSIMYQNLTNYKNNLEEMVNERTSELREARDALWGEMELAKKIQTVLLPREPEIKGYDIKGYMQTADMVGGDYYDVINVEGLDWIVIGDVSGHGVPAGLIMMMVQTSIHSVLTGTEDLKPSELLSRVNSVITENIQKLNEDKYMTITVLACLDNGKFYFSGLHQDIIIYRADKGKSELVETNGIWIGLMHQINQMNGDDNFILNKNDTMLLYSDGITEAWVEGTVRENRDPETDMYGIDRLVEVFEKHGADSPEVMMKGIVDSLNGYEADDDVTMLILKRHE